MYTTLCVLFVVVTAPVHALFEDQVGKFDWRARHIGCPNQVEFGRTTKGRDFLLAASKRNAIAAININTGALDWRQVNEIDPVVPPAFWTHSPATRQDGPPYVALLLNGGTMLRVFHQYNGVLQWQKTVSVSPKTTRVLATQSNVILVTPSSVVGYSATTGEDAFEYSLPGATADLVEVAQTSDDRVLVAAITDGSLNVFAVDAETIAPVSKGVQLGSKPKKCVVFGGAQLACIGAENGVSVVDLAQNAPQVSRIQANAISSARGYLVVASDAKISVYEASVDGAAPQESASVPSGGVYALALDAETGAPVLAVYDDLERVLRVHDVKKGVQLISTSLQPDLEAPIEQLALLSSKNSLQVVTVRRDCRVDLYDISVPAGSAALEWTRFEALSLISAVEMVDLPLSESQARIETEFGAKNAGILGTFLLRITTQIEEIRRLVVATVERVFFTYELISSQRVPVSVALRNLFGDDSSLRRLKKLQPCSAAPSDAAAGLERDYFNLRKVIVATTLAGSVYGINNDDGSVLWSLYLGDDAAPLSNLFGQPRVPLLVQRGSAIIKFDAQAVVAFDLKSSQRSRLLFFNPITGRQTLILERDGVKRFELLPTVTDDMLHPVFTVDRKGQVEVHPRLAHAPEHGPSTVTLFNVDIATGEISGTEVSVVSGASKVTWKSSLGFVDGEQLVQLAGKPATQRVHSQGKVLGDRSVLYKYANPNLIVALSHDPETLTLTVYFIDSVNGQVVHTARQVKAKPPFHVVHCENWVVYAYWSDRNRRTELGIVELYEGAEQTNEHNFNSLTTTKNELEVISKAFIFNQGISAIQASETEQGLSTRSLLIAMPFGGILEVSKRFVDARRPLEMTPELREEMIVPYIPELPVASEELINYNQTVFHVHGIKTAPSGLESTSLMLAYGLDMFYTRVTPSGTFDILKDDFDYVLISVVMVVLVVSSVAVKRVWRHYNLKQLWG